MLVHLCTQRKTPSRNRESILKVRQNFENDYRVS